MWLAKLEQEGRWRSGTGALRVHPRAVWCSGVCAAFVRTVQGCAALARCEEVSGQRIKGSAQSPVRAVSVLARSWDCAVVPVGLGGGAVVVAWRRVCTGGWEMWTHDIPYKAEERWAVPWR